MEIDYEMKVELRDNAVIVIDSTGMKIKNRGDWMRSKRMVSNRKCWIRVHVAYDIKQVVDFEVNG